MKIKNSTSYHNNNKRNHATSYSRLEHHILFDHKYYNGIGKIGQYETITNRTASKDNDTQQDDSSTALDEQYSVGDICMVAQTSKCLQFHTALIQKTSVNTVAVMYLSTNEKGIIHIGYQVQSIEQVG